MQNDRTKTIFNLDLKDVGKDVHLHDSAKFQPNRILSSPQTGTECAAEEKNKIN